MNGSDGGRIAPARDTPPAPGANVEAPSANVEPSGANVQPRDAGAEAPRANVEEDPRAVGVISTRLGKRRPGRRPRAGNATSVVPKDDAGHVFGNNSRKRSLRPRTT